MKIPRIPQNPTDLIDQVNSIDKRIGKLSLEEQRLRRNRTQTSKNRTVAYVRYRESGLNQDRATLDHSTASDVLTSQRLNEIVGELQTLQLRKRYLERLAHKYGIVLKPSISSKEKDEQSGGTFGA